MSSDSISPGATRWRLGLITNDFPPSVGGIQTYFLSLLDSLDSGEVVVVAPDRPGAREIDRKLGFEVVRLPARRGTLLPSPGTASRVADALRKRRVDLVGLSSAMPLGPLGARVSSLLDVPLCVWHHGAELAIPARLPLVRSLLVTLGHRIAIHFVVSRWTESIARSVFGESAPITLMRFGIDVQRFRAPQSGPPQKTALRSALGVGVEEGGIMVLSVGRLVKRKGNDALVAAVASLQDRVPRMRLVIVGSGPDRRRLERIAARFGLGAHVIFFGEADTDVLPELYRAADIFAAPIRSRFFGLEGEGLGITLVEAAATGVPVVAGRSGGTPEAVVDKESGFVVDGRDHRAVAEALARLAGDADLRRVMGERGREHVTRHFSRRGMVETYRAAVTELLESR